MPSLIPVGSETLVNTTTRESQANSSVTQLDNGRYVIVWADNFSTAGGTFPVVAANTDIRGQIYNADGTPSGSEFLINTVTAGAQIRPVVTTLTDGNFLVAWQDGVGVSFGAGNNASLQAREYTSAGVALGNQFQIAATEAVTPQLSPLAGGGFVAVWQAGVAGNVVGQRFDANNAAVGAPITIDSTLLASTARPLVTTLANGNFVVAWANANTAPTGVSMQIFSVSGALVGGEIGVGPTPGSFFSTPASIAALASGGFALAWNLVTTSAPGTSTLNLDYYFPDGTFGVREAVMYIPNSGGFTNADIAPLANGGAIITWTELTPNADGSGQSVRGAAFNGIGSPIGGTFTVNTTTAGDQSTPTVAVLTNGDLVVAWTDSSATGGDTSGAAIRSQRYLYDPTNRVPVAVADVEASTSRTFDASLLTANDTDSDGDPLIVASVNGIQNGTLALNADQTLTFTPNAGYRGPASFNYTISDGAGGTASATATIYFVLDDSFAVRGGTTVNLDFTANDGLPATGNTYTATSGGVSRPVVSVNGTPYIAFDAVGLDGSGLNLPNLLSPYFNLLVGQTSSETGIYTVNNAAFGANQYGALFTVVSQGWMVLGGTARDYLNGTAAADHLSGGTGTANELQGGAGDDWYTAAAVGDTITEFAGGGIDNVRTALNSFALPANVENLYYLANGGNFVGIGNAENNIISARLANGTVALSGGGGDDILYGSLIVAGELQGGIGDDTYYTRTSGDTIIEAVGGGIDTIMAVQQSVTLAANVENLVSISNWPNFFGTGNALDNALTGGSGADTLSGLDGNDTLDGKGGSDTMIGGRGDDSYIVDSRGDSTAELSGEGIDTVLASANIHELQANVENLTFTNNIAHAGIGNGLDNVITGGSGTDELQGGGGNDTLIGGSGADLLIGGAGADLFRYNGGETGYDRIIDFVAGTDKIALANAGFTHTATLAFVSGAGAVATSANSTFLYDTNTGILSYDDDGTGAHAAVQLAQLNTGLNLTVGDFVFV